MFKKDEEYLKDMLNAFEKLFEKYVEDIEVTKSYMASQKKLAARMQAINDLEPKASTSCHIVIKHHDKASSILLEEISKMQGEVQQPVEDLKNLLIQGVAALTRRNLLVEENISKQIILKSLNLDSSHALNKQKTISDVRNSQVQLKNRVD